MKQVRINGKTVPAIGQGTWHIGDDPKQHDREVEALRTGIENGMTLIDTAEMYGYGKSELVVGDAIKPYDREKLFIVSKVLPQNAGKRDMRRSCEESLKRLGTDYLDLYLYHWRGSIPLPETVNCLQELKDCGLIREWGVSNFDTSDMHELSRQLRCRTGLVSCRFPRSGIQPAAVSAEKRYCVYGVLPACDERNAPAGGMVRCSITEDRSYT